MNPLVLKRDVSNSDTHSFIRTLDPGSSRLNQSISCVPFMPEERE